MSWIMVLLIGGGAILIVFLLWIVVAQVKSTKHLETLKKEIQKEDRKVPLKKRPPERAAKPSPEPKAKPGKTTAPKAAVKPQPKPKAEQKPEIKPQPRPAAKPESKLQPKPEPKPQPRPTARPKPKPQPKPQQKAERKPTAYPEFDNARAVEALGLSQEEADMFIGELVTQIESEIPNLEAALKEGDKERLERVSHMLKGSATSLGEGGVADVLVAFNTYCKNCTDLEVARGHLEDLKHYFKALKAKFAA